MDHVCQWGASRNTWAGYRMGLSPTNHVRPKPQRWGPKSLPFKLQPNGRSSTTTTWLVIRQFLVLNWRHEQSYSFRQSQRWANADRTQYICGRRAAWSPLWWWPCFTIREGKGRKVTLTPLLQNNDNLHTDRDTTDFSRAQQHRCNVEQSCKHTAH